MARPCRWWLSCRTAIQSRVLPWAHSPWCHRRARPEWETSPYSPKTYWGRSLPDCRWQGRADGGCHAARPSNPECFRGPIRRGATEGLARNGKLHLIHRRPTGADHSDHRERLPRLYGRGPQSHRRPIHGGHAEHRDRTFPSGVVPLRSRVQRRIWQPGDGASHNGYRDPIPVEGLAGQSGGDEEEAPAPVPWLWPAGDRVAGTWTAAREAL